MGKIFDSSKKSIYNHCNILWVLYARFENFIMYIFLIVIHLLFSQQNSILFFGSRKQLAFLTDPKGYIYKACYKRRGEGRLEIINKDIKRAVYNSPLYGVIDLKQLVFFCEYIYKYCRPILSLVFCLLMILLFVKECN